MTISSPYSFDGNSPPAILGRSFLVHVGFSRVEKRSEEERRVEVRFAAAQRIPASFALKEFRFDGSVRFRVLDFANESVVAPSAFARSAVLQEHDALSVTFAVPKFAFVTIATREKVATPTLELKETFEKEVRSELFTHRSIDEVAYVFVISSRAAPCNVMQLNYSDELVFEIECSY